jgi:hypothetical protein
LAFCRAGYGEVVVAFAQLPLNSRDYPQDFDFDFYTPNFPLVRHLARVRTFTRLIAQRTPSFPSIG